MMHSTIQHITAGALRLLLAVCLLLTAWTGARAAAPKAGTVIMIATADGKALGVKGNSTANEQPLEFQTRAKANIFQQWLVSAIDGMTDAVVLVNMGSGYAIDFSAENAGKNLLQFSIEMTNASQQVVFNADGTVCHKAKTHNNTTYLWYLCTSGQLRTTDKSQATAFTVETLSSTVSVLRITAPDGRVLGIDKTSPNPNAGKYQFPKDYQTSWQTLNPTDKMQWWKKVDSGSYFVLLSLYDESQALDFALNNGTKDNTDKRPSLWNNGGTSAGLNQQLHLDADGHLYAYEGTTPYYLTAATTTLKTAAVGDALVPTFAEEDMTADNTYADAPFRASWVTRPVWATPRWMRTPLSFPMPQRRKCRATTGITVIPGSLPRAAAA